MNQGLVTRTGKILLQLGETIDRYSAARRQATDGVDRLSPSQSRRSHQLVRWFLPNGGTLLIVLLLIFTQSVWARSLQNTATTSTSTISYQGRLADANGNPLTGVYNMEFRVYNHPTAGEPLWTEYWTGGNSVQISDGLFNVMLGSINASLVSAIQGNNELYLGITVGSDTEMTPRIQLGSVPFSMQALTVPDNSITGAKIIENSISNREIAAAAVASEHIIDNAISSIKIAPSAVTNDRIALIRYVIPMEVPDHFPLTGVEQVIGQVTLNIPYAATYVVFVRFTANGNGGQSLMYLRDQNNVSYGAVNHTSSNVHDASIVTMFELPAGQHTLRLTARTASTNVGQVVRGGTHAVIIPVGQVP
jgi:hypothetical protein